MKTTVLLLSLLIFGCNLPEGVKPEAKYANIITKYTEIKQIASNEVNDTFYVYIRLPKNYESSDKKYPVLYLLDGDISFNMATSVVRYLQFGRDIPDMILVAPAYGTLLSDIEINYRERDYTISKVERFNNSGGAKKYLNFLKKELIPLIDSSYRTDGERILNGYSLGGLFSLNTLISSSNLFDHYIAGSPYLINDIDDLAENIAKYKSESPKTVFITVGELENKLEYHEPIKKILDNLSGTKNINIGFMEFKNGTHFTCPPEALAYGLKFIFKKD